MKLIQGTSIRSWILAFARTSLSRLRMPSIHARRAGPGVAERSSFESSICGELRPLSITHVTGILTVVQCDSVRERICHRPLPQQRASRIFNKPV